MKYGKTIGCVDIRLDTGRLDRNMQNAQKQLNEQIVADCALFIPHSQGGLLGSVNYPEGLAGGVISYNKPYAHYQYTGELYLTPDGRSFAGDKEKKIPTGQPLHYHTPGTGDHWFERAKEVHGAAWVDLVKREVGKG